MKYILQYFLPISPFLTELLSDYVMIVVKKKKDWFRGWHRAGMILGVALIYIVTGDRTWQDVVRFLALATIPFLFFDYALNKMRGLKWYYLSTSNGKWWDEILHKANPYWLLTFRVLVAIGLGICYIVLSK